jgi:hypothetical protein
LGNDFNETLINYIGVGYNLTNPSALNQIYGDIQPFLAKVMQSREFLFNYSLLLRKFGRTSESKAFLQKFINNVKEDIVKNE